VILNFGKYRGRSTEEIYNDDPCYVDWVLATYSDNPSFRAAQHAFKFLREADAGDKQASASASLPWFEVLEVHPESDMTTIKNAFRRLIRQYHPDKVADLGVELQQLAHRKTQEINAAYDRAQKERA
jgi:hypothetical protein